jgi:hypothetical protein
MAVKHLKHYLNLWVMEIAVFPNSLKHVIIVIKDLPKNEKDLL